MFKYRIGQKVVCNSRVLEEPHAGAFHTCRTMLRLAVPEHRKVYTIRSQALCDVPGAPCPPGYRLEEIINPDPWFFMGQNRFEVSFDEVLFSPIHDTKKEVEDLLRLGDPSKWTEEDIERITASSPKEKPVAA